MSKEQFKITKTGVYKARDGSKVYITWLQDYNNEKAWGVFDGGDNFFHWFFDGEVMANNHDLDIVSEWEEQR